MRTIYAIIFLIISVSLSGQNSISIEEMHHLAALNTGYDSYITTPLSRPDTIEPYAYFEAGIASKIKLINSKKDKIDIKYSDLELSMYFLLRMYNEESSPIHPLNFEPGLSYTHYIKPKHLHKFSYFTVDLKHMSNGQKGEFYIPGTDTINLGSGNFSTNFIAVKYSKVNKIKDFTFFQTYGIRLDGGIPNTVLSMEEGLKKSYGQTRLMANFQLISPVISLSAKESAFKFRTTLRLENTFIAGDLSNYPDEEKDRYNFKGKLVLYPEESIRLGLYSQFYYGRDYYNLKFTDIFDIWSVGVIYNI